MEDDRYKDKSKKVFFSTIDQKFKKETRGRPPKHDRQELLRKWKEYQNEAFWNDDEKTIKAFCKKENVGYDTMRRYLGRKPMDSLNEYPKKKVFF